MSGPRTILWLERTQVEFIAAVARAAKLSIVGAGSPAKGVSGGVAASLGCDAFDDLRAALASAECDLVLLAASPRFTDPADMGALLGARARGIRIASIEPAPSSALDLGVWSPPSGPSPRDAIRFLGLPRLSRPFREAQEVIASLGTLRFVHIDAFAGPAEGSLAARLFGAIDLLNSLMGEPESVDAAHVSGAFHQGSRTPPGEALADLEGDLSALCRFSDGRAASVAASNNAGRWNFTATLLAEHGRLRVYDDGFEWVGADAQKRDELRIRKAARGDPASSHAVTAIADGIARLTDDTIPDSGPVQLESILGVSQAILLSARTGQPESPGTIRRMIAPAS